VVSNLIGNAIQHSPEDGVVRMTLSGDEQVMIMRTHNGGAPIPREVLPHVFEPGRRGDARAGGLGLGLYIVQQIVLAHRGSIEVHSAQEEGTTFTVVLPRKARGKV
jgi:signal transduction histidine kinase